MPWARRSDGCTMVLLLAMPRSHGPTAYRVSGLRVAALKAPKAPRDDTIGFVESMGVDSGGETFPHVLPWTKHVLTIGNI